MALIRNGSLQSDDWSLLEAGEPLPVAGGVIVPLDAWNTDRAALLAAGRPIGLWIETDTPLEPLGEALHALSIVAVRFRSLADGRGYSSARLLRERFGFAGELRACGAIVPDQVWELTRCGFDSVVIDDARAGAAIAAWRAFSEAYQSSSAQPLPLFRRRAA